mmetsp:Transcript_17560/g.28850  ORF Transcript_17560/g.28850 Transcript_17560/m.28850 type:complete len:319 (+) Transcript_17560:173-1129(+)|eukprot:CAMPEP_0184645908 /NCGR_PEP_ID=MMETSP0308-20130426/2509_1 /TAXON_ID=38269 /ORGANISM="Gloeochaete witrockiana, Strain SAG 46.84" /LENGTH=318 /DNA_ID=CAMNT_0027075405 /DNA_START=155 /DNA_END=1114 /DNA_ORIENTATION=-
MATLVRDRTEQFIKRREFHRNSRKSKPPKTGYSRLQDEDDSPESPVDSQSAAPPPWVNLSEEVNGFISQIRCKMSDLSKKHQQRLRQVFVEEGESEIEHEIQESSDEITKLMYEAESRIKQIAVLRDKGKSTTDKQGRAGATPKEVIRMNVQTALASQLADLSMQLRREQKHYMSKLNGQQGGYSNLTISPSLDDLSSRAGGASVALEDDDDGGEQMRATLNDRLQKEKSEEIRKLASSINDLAQMIKDLNLLVIDQGTMLDRVDYNMEQVNHTIEKGNQELDQAIKYQKSGKFMICVMCLGVTMIALIAVLIFRHSH